MVIGIGLNVSMKSNELPVPTATSLALEGSSITDRNVLLAHILNTFAELLQAWENGYEFLEEYENSSSTIGRKIRIELPGGENLEARAAGISKNGELVLDNGKHVSAGDVIHLR